MRSALLLVLSGLALAAMPSDDPVIARAGDTVFHRSEYAEWLVDRFGTDFVQEYVRDQLVFEEARRLGVHPDAAQLDAAYRSQLAALVAGGYHGDQSKFEEEIVGRGYDMGLYESQQKMLLLPQLAISNIAQSQRVITEEALRQRFEDDYGQEGEKVSLELLFFSAFQRNPGSDTADVTALREAARDRASAARERWQQGTPLAELLVEGDRPPSPVVEDGVVAHYRLMLLGKDVERAVASLDNPGDLSPVVDVYDGSYVIRLVERRKVAFDEVRPELERVLREAPAEVRELLEVSEAVMAARQPVIDLH